MPAYKKKKKDRKELSHLCTTNR